MKELLHIVLFLLPAMCLGQTPNTWEKINDFPGLKRERAISFTIDEFAYVGTGIDTSETTHNDLWKFDPENEVWTQVADLPGPERRNAVAFSIGEYGYVTTGITTAEASDPNAVILRDLWEYSPASNSWTQKADYPSENGIGIYFATGFSLDQKGYVCCGKLGPNNYSTKLFEYKPSIDKWTERMSFPGGVRYQLSSFTLENDAYVGFGTDQDVYNNDLWKYSPLTNSWEQKQSLPGSVRSACMTFSIGTRGFVCMGTNGGYLDDTWEYNPFTDAWSIRANYGGSRRKGGIAFSINGVGYVGTGKGLSGKKQSLYKYYPKDDVLSIDFVQLPVLSVSPNPVKDIAYLNHAFKGKTQVLSLNGRVMHESLNTDQINMADYPSGTYILRFVSDKNVILSHQRILKW